MGRPWLSLPTLQNRQNHAFFHVLAPNLLKNTRFSTFLASKCFKTTRFSTFLASKCFKTTHFSTFWLQNCSKTRVFPRFGVKFAQKRVFFHVFGFKMPQNHAFFYVLALELFKNTRFSTFWLQNSSKTCVFPRIWLQNGAFFHVLASELLKNACFSMFLPSKWLKATCFPKFWLQHRSKNVHYIIFLYKFLQLFFDVFGLKRFKKKHFFLCVLFQNFAMQGVFFYRQAPLHTGASRTKAFTHRRFTHISFCTPKHLNTSAFYRGLEHATMQKVCPPRTAMSRARGFNKRTLLKDIGHQGLKTQMRFIAA